jgi:digeranylgeranylglycerophospholipid reductase
MGMLGALPTEKLSEALYSGSANIGWRLKLQTAIDARDHWRLIYDLYKTKNVADEIIDHYDHYPTDPRGLPAWQEVRDDLMDEVYATTGAAPKY